MLQSGIWAFSKLITNEWPYELDYTPTRGNYLQRYTSNINDIQSTIGQATQHIFYVCIELNNDMLCMLGVIVALLHIYILHVTVYLT